MSFNQGWTESVELRGENIGELLFDKGEESRSGRRRVRGQGEGVLG